MKSHKGGVKIINSSAVQNIYNQIDTDEQLYKLYFRPNKGKYFPTLLELSKLSFKTETITLANKLCYKVYFQESQVDLMAAFWLLWVRSSPGVSFSSKPYEQVMHDLGEFNRVLRKHKYMEDSSTNFIKQPKEYITTHAEIKSEIANGNYEIALNKYYESLNGAKYGVLQDELIYLKRLANIELSSRDLLYYYAEASRSELVKENTNQYCEFIDKIIETNINNNTLTPIGILNKHTKTIPEIMAHRQALSEISYEMLDDKNFVRESASDLFLGDAITKRGRLFDCYIVLTQECCFSDTTEYKWEGDIWVKYSYQQYKENILDKGLVVVKLKTYVPEPSFRFESFKDIAVLNDIRVQNRFTDNSLLLTYTGTSHRVDGNTFYEVILTSEKRIKCNINPFYSAVNRVLYDAENLLREAHDLPRIGEGWISEMRLLNLVKSIFPDATHHYSPDWMAPQHLDIFVPSEKIAFEYQGKQHYEPVDFFGGEAAHAKNLSRDEKKRLKCKKNNIFLIEWKYDLQINEPNLKDILKNFQEKVK